MSKSLWSAAPKWARYAAKDANGRVCFYKSKPQLTQCDIDLFRAWNADALDYCDANGVTIEGDWTKSLRKRPRPTPRPTRKGGRVKAWAYSWAYRGTRSWSHPCIEVHDTRRAADQARKAWIENSHTACAASAVYAISLPKPLPQRRR